jgi:Tol biopolymer transport system component
MRQIAPDATDVAWTVDGDGLLCAITHPRQRAGVYLFPLDGGPGRRIGDIGTGLLDSRGRAQTRIPGASWEPGLKRVAYADDSQRLFVSRPDGSEKRALTDPPSHDYAPSWSPDGTRISFVRDNQRSGGVFVIGADGKGERRVAKGYDAQWSPDGTRLLLTEPWQRIAVADVGSSVVRRIAQGRGSAWSPDGRSIAFVRDELAGKPGDEERETISSTLYIVEPDGTSLRALARAGSVETHYSFGSPLWTPDGRTLLIERYDDVGHSTVVEIDLKGGERTILKQTFDGPSYLTVSPDGNTLAFSSGETIQKLDLRSLERTTVSSSRDDFVEGLGWSPGGDELAYVVSTTEDEGSHLYVVTANGGSRRLVSDHAEAVGTFDWRPTARAG